MMRNVKIILGLLMAIIAQNIFAQASEYIDIVGRADTAIAEQRWDDAETLLVSAMRMEPSNPTNVLLMSNLGMVRLYAGRDSLALDILNHAHAIAPGSVTILSNRAKVLRAIGRDKEAYADYELILQLDSAAIEPRFMHGMMAMYGGDVETAESDFKMLERLAPDDDYTAIGLASLYSATGRPFEAIIQYTKLLNRSKEIEYYSGRAAMYLLTDQLGEAASDIAEGLAINPNDAELYLYRAYLNKLRYSNADAQADLKRAIELGVDPQRAEMLKKHLE